MQTWMVFGLGVALGGLVAFVALRLSYAASLAGARTEAALLRERIVDLEASLSEDAETAAVLAPLRDALGRVERQVGTLERDRVDQFSALRTLMTRVEAETQAVGHATTSLAGSLRSSTTRGSWGEVQLRRVLELLRDAATHRLRRAGHGCVHPRSRHPPRRAGPAPR